MPMINRVDRAYASAVVARCCTDKPLRCPICPHPPRHRRLPFRAILLSSRPMYSSLSQAPSRHLFRSKTLPCQRTSTRHAPLQMPLTVPECARLVSDEELGIEGDELVAEVPELMRQMLQELTTMFPSMPALLIRFVQTLLQYGEVTWRKPCLWIIEALLDTFDCDIDQALFTQVSSLLFLFVNTYAVS